jgi:hypothetical protein
MANDFTGPTWYVDTAMTTESPIWKNCDCYIQEINWSRMALNDQLTITDRNGKVIFDLTANAANQNINLPHCGWQKGLIVTSLGSGNVQIAVGK